MPHTHRLEIRIAVPRRGPVKIEVDAQDVAEAEVQPAQARSPHRPGDAWLAMPA